MNTSTSAQEPAPRRYMISIIVLTILLISIAVLSGVLSCYYRPTGTLIPLNGAVDDRQFCVEFAAAVVWIASGAFLGVAVIKLLLFAVLPHKWPRASLLLPLATLVGLMVGVVWHARTDKDLRARLEQRRTEEIVQREQEIFGEFKLHWRGCNLRDARN